MPARRFLVLIAAVAAAALFVAALPVSADTPATQEPPGPFALIHVVDFPTQIGAVLAAYVGRQLDAALDADADCVVLRIESPGGTVHHSMEIADRLQGLPDTVHTVAWIPKEAYSGAAMVTLACDEIVMGWTARFGDAQPGLRQPDGWRPVGEKAETVLRERFRAYAESNGYEKVLAAAMVSARIEVLRVRDPAGNLHFVRGKGFRDADPDAEPISGLPVKKKDLVQVGPRVVTEDELLTLTAAEAAEYGFLRRTFDEGHRHPDSEEELLRALKAEDGVVRTFELSFSEQASRHLLTIAGVLSAIVALSLMVLLWQGPGLMTIVGGVCLVLLILINLTADQLNGFPIFLLLLGTLLLATEVFLIPGFGFAGVLGVIALGAGFLFLATGVTLGDSAGVSLRQAMDFGLQYALTILGGVGLLFLLSRFVPTIGPARRLVLAAPDGPPVGTEVEGAPPARVGEQGRTTSPLRPAGTAEIDGRLVDVATDGGFVAAGSAVEVTHVEGNRVTVRPVEAEAEDGA